MSTTCPCGSTACTPAPGHGLECLVCPALVEELAARHRRLVRHARGLRRLRARMAHGRLAQGVRARELPRFLEAR